jgi:HK97 family phage prohead protease
MFLRPVEGNDDLFQFRFDFSLEGKAVEDVVQPVVTELDDGDLLIEGYAAVWEGDDRQGENFAPGAFQRGIEKFLKGQAALCYHHKHDKCLGKVLDLKEEGKGLKMRARVDGAIKGHPELGTIYQQIKRGTYNGLSTFGYFTRGLIEGAKKIVDVDLTEISVTPVPVHPGTSLAVVAGKALASDIAIPEPPKVEEDEEIREDDLRAIGYLVEELDNFFRRIEDSVGKRKDSVE